MSRLSRREIKRDEVQEGMFSIVEWLGMHARTILIGAGAVLGLIVVVTLVMNLLGNRAERAQTRLGRALAVYSAPINAEAADPDNERNPSFASEDARRERAKTMFEDVHESYASTAAGRISAVYLGEIAAHDGDNEHARQLWQEFLRKDPDNALAVTVRLNLIALDRQEGKDEQVATELRKEIDGGSKVPADLLLYQLGLVLEDQGKNDEARAVFQRLVDEHPQSSYASEARTRLS